MPKIETFPNGVRLVSEIRDNVRSAAIGVWVNTGSVAEKEGEYGLSHMLEHMVFKGTHKRSAEEIAQIMDAIGGYMNAYTSKETTCYYTKVMDEHFPIACDILSDIVLSPLLSEADLEKEKRVVLEEISMTEDTPEDLVHEVLSAAYYGEHPLARPIAGTEDSVKSFDAQALRRYYECKYTGDEIVISACGHFDEQALIRFIDSTFARLPASGNKFVQPGYEGLLCNRLLYRQKQTEQVQLTMAYPAFCATDENRYTMHVLNNILGGGMSSRLFQKIREQKGLAYSVYSFPQAYCRSGVFGVYAAMSPSALRETAGIICAQIQDILDNGVEHAELVRAREQLKGSYVLGLEGVSGRMSANGRNVQLFGRIRSEDEVLCAIMNVDEAAVMKVAQSVFRRPYAAAIVGNLDEEQKNEICSTLRSELSEV